MNSQTSNDHQLTQDAQFIKGVGPSRAVQLNKLGLKTAADLLFFFPRRYEDFTGQSQIQDLQVNETASVLGTIDDIEQQQGGGRHVLYVLLKQDQGYLRGIWFNQSYMSQKFRMGQTVQFLGKVSERGGQLQMTHPQVTWIDDADTLPKEELQGVYRLTDGINQYQMRRLITGVVESHATLVNEAIPVEIREAHQLLDIVSAIRHIHNPQSVEQLAAARRRLVFQELLVLQLALSMRRHLIRSRAVAPAMEMTGKIRARILGRLPFRLRPSQRQALEEISQDMAAEYPMNRLLHGEVGSGKTAVAACALMLTVAHSHQAVLMAPTEILVEQHFQTMSKWLTGSRVRMAKWTGGMPSKERLILEQQVENGDIDVVIGTTAVLEGKARFPQLGLVVIDEQHKFGVRQRALLKQAGFDPHYLVMTATPIPRTMTMTLFGDLEVSTLQRDASDSPIINTYVSTDDKREKWWEFFRQKLTEGRQGFVVAPFVDAGDDAGIGSAEQLFESLVNGPLHAFRLSVLHGRQSTEQKQATMQQFAEGKIQVLVATGVIEVGIDVPNASLMTIESAERFGLSQLHQLRGRVGRGRHPGYVCAFPSPSCTGEIDRLKAFESSNDGFELAERDLQLRGPGNLLSTRQTGFPPLRIADLIRDEAILREAQGAAREVIEVDPDLARESFQRLRSLVISRYGRALDLSDVG